MKLLQTILLLLFSLSFVSASSISYSILGEKTLVEINLDNLDEYNIKLPEDYTALDRTSNSLKYITSSLVEKSGKRMLFLVDEKLIRNIDEVNLVLPEGYHLSEGMPIYPKNYQTITDGQSIIISFQKPTQTEILVFYETSSNNLSYILGIIFISLATLFAVGLFLRSKLNKKKNLTKNLYREEKKIVEFLIKNGKNGIWTKDLAHSLEIPKVRLSRKLRNLEEKGIIKREPFGNENKIFLKN